MNSIDLEEWAKGGDPTKKLWALILLLALKDRANRVSYDSARGDRALTYEIDDVEYAMVPPPDEMAKDIERVMREALVPLSMWRRVFGRWMSTASMKSGTFFAKVHGNKAKIEGATDPAQANVNLFIVSDPEMAAKGKAELTAILAVAALETEAC